MPQLIEICHNPRPQRVQVKVTNQFQQVRLFLAQNGLVAVLKELPVAAVAPVEAHGITGQQPSHEKGDALGDGFRTWTPRSLR